MSKEKGLSTILGIIMVLVLILAGTAGLTIVKNSNITSAIYKQNNASLNSENSNNAIENIQEVQIEGLLNQQQISPNKLNLNDLQVPTFKDRNDNVFTGPNAEYDFEDIKKENFYCLPKGKISDNTVTIFIGESKYETEKAKLEFDREYLFKNLDITLKDEFKDKTVVFCWKETDQKLVLNMPDFGLVYYSNFPEDNLDMTTIVFVGNNIKTIKSHYYKELTPLYFNSEELILSAFSGGGGWSDNEVLNFNIKTMTFHNEDNCASIFPRDSESLKFDENCFSGYEYQPDGTINDYGFKRINDVIDKYTIERTELL